jgi:hypothetical protein
MIGENVITKTINKLSARLILLAARLSRHAAAPLLLYFFYKIIFEMVF